MQIIFPTLKHKIVNKTCTMLFGYLAPLVKRAVYNFVPTSTAKLELDQSPLTRYIGDYIQITSKNRLTVDTTQKSFVGHIPLFENLRFQDNP